MSILFNHFSFIIIPITVDGLSEHFKVYKSEMSIQGEIKDYCFLYHSVLPTLAILSVFFFSSFHFLLLGEYSYMGRNPPSLYSWNWDSSFIRYFCSAVIFYTLHIFYYYYKLSVTSTSVILGDGKYIIYSKRDYTYTILIYVMSSIHQ